MKLGNWVSEYECGRRCSQKNTRYFIHGGKHGDKSCECQPGLEDGSCPLVQDNNWKIFAFKKYGHGA